MLTVVAIIIITFSYTSTDKAIRALSDREMHYAHETILNKINDVLSVSQVIAQITKEIVSVSKEPFSPENVSHYINEVLSHRMTDAIRIVLADGNYLSVNDLTLINIPGYFSRPGVSLPSGSRVAVRRIDPNSTPPTETWEYLSTDLVPLGQEIVGADPI